jgi:hypothetical protein
VATANSCEEGDTSSKIIMLKIRSKNLDLEGEIARRVRDMFHRATAKNS